MNMFKKALIVLLIIFSLITTVSFFFPGKIHIERTGIINAPAKTVFDQVNTLKSWKNWSYWDRIDPKMKSVYEGPESGMGAIHKWTSLNDSVGTGCLTITESQEKEKILYTLTFEDMGSSNGGWEFSDSAGSVKTTTFMDIEMPFYGRIFPGIFIEKSIGIDFEKTISGLKEYTENYRDEPVTEWKVEKLNTVEKPVLSMKIKCTGKEFKLKLEEAFVKLSDALSSQGLQQTGNRYTIFYVWSKDSVEMEPGIPINEPGKSESEILASTLPSMTVVKIDYYGSDGGSELAYNYLNEWLSENKVVATGAPWEEYAYDPTTESDTSKWLTMIYYPVE